MNASDAEVTRAEFDELRSRIDAASDGLKGANQQISPSKPSMGLVLDQLGKERDAINAHTDSLDTKAGLVLGFAGVLVGFTATATHLDFRVSFFRVGLWLAVLAAVSAALALRPRFKYEKLNVEDYKSKATDPAANIQTQLLTDLSKMIVDFQKYSWWKQLWVFLSVVALAAAAGLVVSGALMHHSKHLLF